jgi:ribonuclease VapC
VQDEPGAAVVAAALAEAPRISAVNLSEVFAKAAEAGREAEAYQRFLASIGLLPGVLRVEPFGEADALAAAQLRAPTRRFGLSFADRACLALALRVGEPVVTADRRWGDLDLPVEVRLIR